MKDIQQFLTHALTNTQSRWFAYTNDVLAVVTIISISAVVLETVPSLASYQYLFAIIEYGAVVIFSLEYLARLSIATPHRRYIFSVYGIIDLLAILPTILMLGNLTFLKSARIIRLIRLLRMLRLSKLKRVQHQKNQSNLAVVSAVLLGLVLLGTTLLVGVLMYLAEGNNPAFSSIPLSMLWTLKMFLLGIPIEYPETLAGEVVHIFGRIVGLTVFGVIVGIVGNGVKEYLFSQNSET